MNTESPRMDCAGRGWRSPASSNSSPAINPAGSTFANRAALRYANRRCLIFCAKPDGNGEFSVTWPEAGMYWLETGTEDTKTSIPQAKQRRLSYVATLEVLPQ